MIWSKFSEFDKKLGGATSANFIYHWEKLQNTKAHINFEIKMNNEWGKSNSE